MLHLCVSARVRTRSVAVSPTPKKSLSHTHRTCTLAQGNLLFTEANPWPSTRTNASAATSTSTTPSPERLSHQGWGGRGRGGSLPQTPEIASAGPWPWEKAEYKVTLGDRLKELVAPLHSSRSWPTPGQAAQDAAPVPAAWCVVKRVVRYAVLAPPPVVVYACLSGLFGSKHACLSGLFGCKHARTRAHTHTPRTHTQTHADMQVATVRGHKGRTSRHKGTLLTAALERHRPRIPVPSAQSSLSFLRPGPVLDGVLRHSTFTGRASLDMQSQQPRSAVRE